MSEFRESAEKLLVELEALRAQSWRNHHEAERITVAIEKLKAKISPPNTEKPAAPISGIEPPGEVA
jgi:hypothetical protein